MQCMHGNGAYDCNKTQHSIYETANSHTTQMKSMESIISFILDSHEDTNKASKHINNIWTESSTCLIRI